VGGKEVSKTICLRYSETAWNFMPAYDENPKTAKEEEKNSG
jgi:hypothetical protein